MKRVISIFSLSLFILFFTLLSTTINPVHAQKNLLQVMQEQNQRSKFIAEIGFDDSMVVLERKGKWIKISVEAGVGYVLVSDFRRFMTQKVNSDRRADPTKEATLRNRPLKTELAFSMAETAQGFPVPLTHSGDVWMRSGKSLQSESPNVIPRGSTVQLLEMQGAWCKIQYKNDIGYVRAYYLGYGDKGRSTDGNETVGALPPLNVGGVVEISHNSPVTLRSSKSKDSESLAVIPPGGSMKLLATEGDWAKVNANGKIGYIRRVYVHQNQGATPSSSGVQQPGSPTNTTPNSSTPITSKPVQPPTSTPATPTTENPNSDVEPPAQVDHSSVAYKVFLCTNKERVANGVAPLVWDNALAAVAKGHSLDMKKRKYFAHTSPDGKTFIDRMEAAGLKIGAAGENIASAGSAESVVARWMASPGHRKNILKPQYKALGVGTGGPFVQLFNSRIIAPDSTITPSSNSMNSEEKQLVALYQETLGRAPDAAGLKFYSDKMKAGTSLETIRQSIYDSPEYQAKSTPTPSSPPTENQDPFVGIPGPSNPQTLAYQVYTLTNKERREYRNAFPLVWDSALAAVAQAHAKDMKARNFLSSKNPEGQNHQDRLRAAGIQWKYVTGENVAMGSTPAGVISQWMGSASHKSNIWNTHFRAVGVGVDGGYFVQLFSDKPNVTAPPIKKEAKQVFELVNKVRAEHGVAPFIWDDAVAAVAQSHATDMKVRNFTGHTNPDGLDQKERVIALVDCNKCKLLVGEMIGTGSSPEDVLATDFAATNFAGKPQICNNQYLKVGVGVEGDTYVLLYTHKREN